MNLCEYQTIQILITCCPFTPATLSVIMSLIRQVFKFVTCKIKKQNQEKLNSLEIEHIDGEKVLKLKDGKEESRHVKTNV